MQTAAYRRPSRVAARPIPMSNRVLRRRCACGTHTPGGVECPSCRASQRAPTALAPPIVHEVLRAPGNPLDPGVRTVLEPRFGRDFSAVRVHSDGTARAAAEAVDAAAFAVGQHIVLGAGRQPASTPLIAHELAHTVQQLGTSARPGEIEIGAPHDAAEREADAMTERALFGRAPHSAESTAGEPRLRRQTSSPEPRPLVSLPPPLDRLDIKPEVPQAPIQPPTLHNVEQALQIVQGQKPDGSADCRGMIGFTPGTGAFKGQCCQSQANRDADHCCDLSRFSVKDNRCCHTGEVLKGTSCVKSEDLGVQPGPTDRELLMPPPAEKPPLQDLPERTLPPGQAYA